MSNEQSKYHWENIFEEKGQTYQIPERIPRFVFWTCRITLQMLYFVVEWAHKCWNINICIKLNFFFCFFVITHSHAWIVKWPITACRMVLWTWSGVLHIHHAGLILHGGNEGDCLRCPLSLPWCPWNAPVGIYNFLIGCPLPKKRSIQPWPYVVFAWMTGGRWDVHPCFNVCILELTFTLLIVVTLSISRLKNSFLFEKLS